MPDTPSTTEVYSLPGEEPTVLFEDAELLVLNKPPGWVVNRANSVKAYTLQDWVEAYLAGQSTWEQGRAEDELFRERSGMIHRLDKDTSGVILFAKTPAVMTAMMAQFKARQVQKTYLALVHEHLAQPEGIIAVGIQRHPQDRERFSVSSEGRDSVTHYRVQREYQSIDLSALKARLAAQQLVPPGLGRMIKIYQGFSLVELQPKTGRTHQLRVHLKFLHHPIVGDERYVGRKRYRVDQLWMPRQWLHAWKIEFRHPVTGESQLFIAPLAQDLEESLQLLG